MTQFLTATLLLLVSLVTASGGDKATPESSQVWTPPPYAKVIGYRFRLPGENSKEAVPSGFTLLPDGLLDSALLAKQKTKSAELKPADIRRLTSAINAAKVVSQAAWSPPSRCASAAPASRPSPQSPSLAGVVTISSPSQSSHIGSGSGTNPALFSSGSTSKATTNPNQRSHEQTPRK